VGVSAYGASGWLRHVDVATHIDVLDREGARLADAAERAGLDTPVPSCPDWTVRDLVVHMATVHRWANANLRRASTEPMSEEENAAIAHPWPDDAAELFAAYRKGHADLVETLRTGDPDLVAWSFLPAPSPRAFWARRQAHETAIHRADAELASGAVTAYDAAFAADGLDEFLRGFASRPRRHKRDSPMTVLIEPADDPAQWLLTLGPDGLQVVDDGPPDSTVSGPASALYLWVWNRGDDQALSVKGDVSLLDMWRTSKGVVWG
jgi:uncharacterized protein (TIGR03083 family)